MTLLTFALGFVACQEEPEYDTPSIDLSEETWSVEAEGGELAVQVKSNRDWKIEISGNEDDDLSWISVDPEEAPAGETEATIAVLENKGDERSAVVRFATETLYKSIKVTQKGVFVEEKGLTEFFDDFSSITEPGKEYKDNNWKFYSTEPGIGWLTGYFDKATPPETSLEIKAYKAQGDQLTAFAMMPSFNVKEAAKKEMTFSLAFYYKEFDATKVELVASTDYSGSIQSATWEVVEDCTIAEDRQMNSPVSYTADLSKYADQQSVYFAFRYTGKAVTYRINYVSFNKENGGGGDNPVNPDVPAAVESFADDFSSITAPGQIYDQNNWNFFSTDASVGWRTGYFDKVTPAETSLEIKAFMSANNKITAYAMMPPFKVKSAQNKTLKFALAYYYKEADATMLEVVASTDYDGDVTKATWEVVKDCTIAEGEQMNQQNRHAIDLSKYADSDCVFVAFRYTGKAITYRLYDVSFNKEGGDTPVDPENPEIPEAVETFKDDFSSITSAGQNYNSDKWLFGSSDASLGWRTGYFDKVSPAETSLEVKAYKAEDGITAYAMMAPFKVKSAQNKDLKFQLAFYYKNFDATKVEVVASKDFNGDFDKATWEVVKDCTIAENTDGMNKKNDYTVSLSKFADSDCVFVAFRYTGKEVTYRLYNVSFNEEGETPVEPGAPKNISISELRAMAQGDIVDNYFISGTVVSGSNLHGQSIALQDGKKAGSGIIVRTNEKHSFALGQKLKVGIFGGSLSEYNGVLQISVKDDAKIESVAKADAANADAMLTTITVDQLNEGNYESMYIAIENAQINSEFFGKTFRVGEKDGTVRAKANGKEFPIYTNIYADFAQVTVPEGKGTIKGIQSEFKETQQLLCQRESDFAALNNGGVDPEPQPGEPKQVTIKELRAMGVNTEISDNLYFEAVVVAKDNQSNKNLTLQDGTAEDCGIIVRMKEAHEFALGEKVKVNLQGGNLSEFNGIFQANCKEDAMVESIAAADMAALDAMLKIITVDQLNAGKYQSMYVGIENAEFNADAVGTAFSGNKIAKSNGQEFTVYTNNYAPFKDELVPAGKGTVKGIQSLFKGNPQVLCQRVSDFEGFKEEGGNPDIPNNPVRPSGTEFSLGNYDNPDRTEAWDGFNLQNAPFNFNYLHSGSQLIYTPDQIGAMKGQEITSMSFKCFTEMAVVDAFKTDITLYLSEVEDTQFRYNDLAEAYEWFDFDRNNVVASATLTLDFLNAFMEGTDVELIFDFSSKPFKYNGKTLVATIVNENEEFLDASNNTIQFYWIKPENSVRKDWKSLVFASDSKDFYTNQAKDNVVKTTDNEDKWKDSPIVKFTYNKTGNVDPEPQPGNLIFSEYFDFCNGAVDNPTQKIDFASQLPGWDGTNVYEGNGMVKLGASKTGGYITTPALTEANGDIVVRFKASAWPKDKADITIELIGTGTASVTEFTGLPESKTDLQSYEFTISGASANTQIVFKSSKDAKNRFFFDALEISAK